MASELRFVQFGWQHGLVLGLVLVGVLLMWRLGVRARLPRGVEKGLAVGLVLHWPLTLWSLSGVEGVEGPVRDVLPLHLCDVVGLVCAAALWWGQPWMWRLTFFGGLAGTLQGILTPDLAVSLPHPFALLFFFQHGVVVLAAFYAVWVVGWRPVRWEVWWAFGALQGYALVAGLTNALLDSNYGFLCAKPVGGSLMDVLGPWPWYIGAMQVLALGAFWLLWCAFGKGK